MPSANAMQVFSSILPTIGQTNAGQVIGLRSNRTSATTGTSSSSTANDGGLGTTFLTLLSQELQNQDPTNPVDSTAMVGQMISLNQLDQLISINQILSGASTGTSTTANGSLAKAHAATAAISNPTAGGSAFPQTQLPFDPNTLMPLNLANPAGVAAKSAASQLYGDRLPGSIN